MHDYAKDVVAVIHCITARADVYMYIYLYILLSMGDFFDFFAVCTSRPIWLFAAKGVVVHDFIMTLYEHVNITGLLHDSMFCARYNYSTCN